MITMAARVSPALLSVLLLFTLSFAAAKHHNPLPVYPPSNNPLIRDACKASLHDPSKCQSSLYQSNVVPPNATLLQVIQSALRLSSQNLETASKMVHDVLAGSARNSNSTQAVHPCFEFLRLAKIRADEATAALPRDGGRRIKDARAWASAALTYQYGCRSGLSKVNDTAPGARAASFFDSALIPSTSDALAMMFNYDVHSDNIGSWGPPKTEREGFWEPSGSGISGQVSGLPTRLEVHATVCKGGKGSGCNYATVQEAVNAAPNHLKSGKRYVIRIKVGVYEEYVRVPMRKKNVVFLGEGMGKTVITGSRSVGLSGHNTYDTATVGVNADGFMASNLTIQNTAGANANQAVAFRSDGDRTVMENCEFIGNQDTLCPDTLRQYYKSCRIQGNVDFIFGSAAAFFENCIILVSPRPSEAEKGAKNVVAAHGRMDPAQPTGFVFRNCVINGTDKYLALYNSNPKIHVNFLGRPWKEYSRVVFIQCEMGSLISPDGWMHWEGDFGLKTLYFGEFGNTGLGSNTALRVVWSSKIPADQANKYTVQNFIQGDQWIPKSSSSS